MPPPPDTRACWTRSRITLPRIACPRCSRGTTATLPTPIANSRGPLRWRPTTWIRALRRRSSPPHRTTSERAATSLREGVERAPYSIPLWVALGHAELARRDGDCRRAGVRPGPAFRAGGRANSLQSWRGVADGRRRGPGGACLPACAGAAAGLRVGMFQSWRALPAAGKDGRGDRGLPAGAGSSIPAMPRHTRIWARSCSPPARSTHGSRIFAPSRRTARTRCPLAVQALEVSQLTGDYAKLDSYLEGLRREKFPAGDELELVDALEELLGLLAQFRRRARDAAPVRGDVRHRGHARLRLAATARRDAPAGQASPGLSFRRPARPRDGQADVAGHPAS